MHIRHLAVIRKKGIHTCENVLTHTEAHTHKYIFNIIMTSRTLQESQQDWDGTKG